MKLTDEQRESLNNEIINQLMTKTFEPANSIEGFVNNLFRRMDSISKRGSITISEPYKNKKVKFNISPYINETLSKTKVIYMHDMIDIADVNVTDEEAGIFTTSTDTVESIVKLSQVSQAIPTIPIVIGNKCRSLGFRIILPDASRSRNLLSEIAERSSFGYISGDIELCLHKAMFKGINTNGTVYKTNYKYNSSTDGFNYKLGPYVIYVPGLIMLDDLNRVRDNNPLKFNLLMLVCPSPKRVVKKVLFTGKDKDENGINPKREQAFYELHCNQDITSSSLNETFNKACNDLHFKKVNTEADYMKWYKSKIDMIYAAELLDVAAKLKCKTLLIDTGMMNAKYPTKDSPSEYDLNKEWQTIIGIKRLRESFESIIFTGVSANVDYKEFNASARLY